LRQTVGVLARSSATALTAERNCERRARSLAAGSVAASVSSTAAEATRVRKSLSEMRRPAMAQR
jgi:hypothetical protein